jgi:hypothetical protein
MAFAPGRRARVKLSNGVVLVAGAVQPQPPLLGVVQVVAGLLATDLITVLMEDGRLLTVEAQFLDEITDTNSVIRDSLIDKVVNGWITAPNPPLTAGVSYSSEYTGRVVDVYDLADPFGTRVLIRSLSNGMYYELPYASVNATLVGR